MNEGVMTFDHHGGWITRRNGPPRARLDAQVRTQLSSASARTHSPSSLGLRARKLMPSVPNLAALVDCGAPAKTSARQVISKPTNPAATTVA